MTTRYGSTHPYVTLLFLWEMVLGVVTLALVVLVFPNAPQFSGEFWFEASPAEWTVWALCILGLIGRLYILGRKELQALNKRLNSLEYQKWTASFDQSTVDTQERSCGIILESTYQYLSWWVAGGLASLGIALLAIDLSLDRPNLYDLALVGGYLVIELSSRTVIETLWRYPGLQSFKHGLGIFVDEFRGGLPPFKMYLSWRIFLPGKYLKYLLKSGFISQGGYNLDISFEDPLYLPEDYVRTL